MGAVHGVSLDMGHGGHGGHGGYGDHGGHGGYGMHNGYGNHYSGHSNMPWWGALIIVGAFVLIFFSAAIMSIFGKSKYQVDLNAAEKSLVGRLVNEVGPKLKADGVEAGDVTKKMVDDMVDGDDAFDQEMYFLFKSRYADGTLTEADLLSDLRGTS